MIALGGPKLKRQREVLPDSGDSVSMIALGGPKLKLRNREDREERIISFNDSTGWA